MTTGEKTIQTSSRTDRSGHSVLQTLGQAQGGGDDGGGVGCVEFSCSVVYGRVLIEYDPVYTISRPCNSYIQVITK